MRLLIMFLILIGVVTGMLQCAKRTMGRKHAPPPRDGLMPASRRALA
jgi:hypothetical protein